MPASTAPVNELWKYQVGKEVTWGTVVAATAQLGLVEDLTITPKNEAQNLEDRRASLAPAYVAALLKESGEAKMSGIVTYEDLPFWLDGLMGIATPSGANPYTYAYPAPLGTVPTRRSFTLIKGNGSNVYTLSGATIKEATFTVETGQPMKYDLSFVGKLAQTGTLASLSDRTQTPILAPQFTSYIDAVGGTIGTTAITTNWFSAELKISTNADVYMGIGALTPVGFRESRWSTTLKLKYELDSTSKAMVDSIIGSSLLQKQIRVKATTGASAIAQFDVAGSYLKAPEIFTDSDGVVSVELEMDALYNSTLANFLKASVTNAVSALP